MAEDRWGTEELVEHARSRKFDASIVDGIEEPPYLVGLSFSELVEQARVRAANAAHDDPQLRSFRKRARYVLAQDASEDQVEELARRSFANHVLSHEMNFRPEECAQAPAEGPGLELLQTPGRAVIGAFAHTAPFPVAYYGLPRVAGRPIFVPGDKDPAKFPALRMCQFHTEEQGLRYITELRPIETMGALLEAGEVCALAADQPGPTEARFFGVWVRSRAGAATLAMRTGHPVVIGAAWYDDERFGIRVGALEPADFSSPLELHQAILDETEAALGGDFARYVGDLHVASGWRPAALAGSADSA